jgi:hypothetical protein
MCALVQHRRFRDQFVHSRINHRRLPAAGELLQQSLEQLGITVVSSVGIRHVLQTIADTNHPTVAEAVTIVVIQKDLCTRFKLVKFRKLRQRYQDRQVCISPKHYVDLMEDQFSTLKFHSLITSSVACFQWFSLQITL